MQRTVFFVSDRTGITAQTLGRSLLTQFEQVQFKHINRPFIDSIDKAHGLVGEINRIAGLEDSPPLVFLTLVDREISRLICGLSRGRCFDLFETFLGPLEETLGVRSSHTAGRSHGLVDPGLYDIRMDAVNYALGADDGAGVRDYGRAEVILVGVSRSGKTPTCLYLALQFGVYAANYPLTDADLNELRLPTALEPHRSRLFGLTIRPERLQRIRQTRRADSRYASTGQCRREIQQVEALYRRFAIPYLDTTRMSIEELATTVVDRLGIGRRY